MTDSDGSLHDDVVDGALRARAPSHGEAHLPLVDVIGPGRVLVFAPHPDDEVLGCGGAIRAHVEAGDALAVVVVTDGGRGDPGGRAAYVTRRREECARAAAVLGYQTPVFWDYRDGELSASRELVARLSAAIEAHGATHVYGPSVHERHPDHRALGIALVAALASASGSFRLILYEVGALSYPSLLLDISARWDVKRAALSCFRSQLERLPYDEHMESLNRYRTVGLPARARAVEAFRVVERSDLDAGRLALSSAPHLAAPEIRDVAAPLVSVVVAEQGNGELDETLASVARQTYPHLEVVLVSSPRAGAAARPQACGRFPLRVLGVPPACVDAREHYGLAVAEGRFVGVIQDGVRWHPEHVAELVHALVGSPHASVAHRGFEAQRKGSSGDEAADYEPSSLILRASYGEPVALAGALFASSLYRDACRRDCRLGPLGARDFLIRAVTRTGFVYVPGVDGL